MTEKPVILVVDDDAPILLLMRHLLREFGFETITAASGDDAIRQARKERPSLMLLDKNMPGMSGIDVIRKLRGDEGFETMPILILSGEPVTKSELAALGANDAVMKPFDVPALIRQIRSHLDSNGS